MALKLFTDIIKEDPKWAEGWNKRATLLFIMGNYEKSLDDIEKVLDLEPRHFGALSGRAQIYLSYKQYEKAIDDLRKAKSIYPLIKSGENIQHRLAVGRPVSDFMPFCWLKSKFAPLAVLDR